MADKKILSIQDGLSGNLPDITTAKAGRILITTDRGEMYYEPKDGKRIQINSQSDLSYNSTSKNAQSGFAVAQAINESTATNLKNGSAKGSLRTIGSKEEDPSYKLGNYAMAEGLNTQSGAKAFTILGVDKTNKTYTLDSTEGLTVGDIYSAHVLYTTGASSQAENYGKITATNGNIVTVDKLWCEGDFATSDSYISGGYDGEKNTFRIISKPNIGTRVIADVSHAEGVSTKVLSKGSHSEGKGTIAYGSWSHAEGNNTKAGYSSHAEGNNTTSSGFNSHAEGEKTTSSGWNSHAEGVRTVSSGFASHAEGSDTKASDTGSHSEGFKTIASGFASHAEGNSTKSIGINSHAEGYYTKASGASSHAEGQGTVASYQTSHAEGQETVASDGSSHAEGYRTKASGHSSHTEGNNTTALSSNAHAEGRYTIASSDNQHVQGKYNIPDNTSADIVGNGTHTENRSNAYTLDWSGNAWYAGDIYTGSTSGTNRDEGSKKLATEEYVDEEIANFDFIKIVTELPETGLINRTYFVPKSDPTTNDLYDEYMWVDGKWELITTKQIEVDLTGYVKHTDINQSYDPTSENAQSGKAVAEAVAPKLDKPSMPPAVGNILKVLSVNDDGTFTCGWSDAPSGGAVDDVKIAGSSIVVDGVATIPTAKTSNDGVTRIAGEYALVNWRKDSNQKNSYVVSIGETDNAVRLAMCDGKGAAWTADEQAAARSRMGVGEYDLVVDVTITEETQNINIETDSLGNPLNLKQAMVIIYTVGTTSNSGEGAMLIRLFHNSNSKGANITRARAFRNNPDVTTMQYALTVGDFAICSDSPSRDTAILAVSSAMTDNNPFKALGGIYLSGDTTGSNTFGIGSRVLVYGVRA